MPGKNKTQATRRRDHRNHPAWSVDGKGTEFTPASIAVESDILKALSTIWFA